MRFCAFDRFKPTAEQHSGGPPPPRTPKNRQGMNEVRIMNTLAAAESTSRSQIPSRFTTICGRGLFLSVS